MSFYTKYRPQTIAELDLDSVRTALSTILTSGKFAHAYLFAGPKGTGKTSSARIIAKLINCDQNRKQLDQRSSKGNHSLSEPCNQCDSCRRITNGSSLACMEMDAASNRGIDDIRQLKERIGLAPAEGLFTVYIIDEVHMLTTEAFNALLKTLEEPPAHAVFMLCTTDPQKIPETVVSRCTLVRFTKATVAEIVHSLQKAVNGEGLQPETGVLELVASRVDGSFRDGMKTLEQLAQHQAIIGLAQVDEMLGYGSGYDAGRFIQALKEKDIQTALQELKQKEVGGVDMTIFSRRIVENLRAELLPLLGSDPATAKTMIELSRKMSDTAVTVRQAVIPVLCLEIAAAEWCLSGTAEIQPKAAEPVIVRPAPPAQPQPVTPAPVKRVEAKPSVAMIGSFAGGFEDILKQWPQILAAVKPLNHSLEALLRSAHPSEYCDGWLTIEAYYKFHKEQLEQDRYRRKLEEVIGSVLGGAIYLKFSLGEKAGSDPKVENVSGTVEDDALVKAAEEIFGK